MLGIVTDLRELAAGVAKADNKPERLQEIAGTITSILKARTCPKPLIAELRGRAQYASAQISGRLAVGTLNKLAEHQYRQTSEELSRSTIEALKQLLYIVTHAKPRTLSCSLQSLPILVFTDGAAEEHATTMGAVVIDTAGQFQPFQWGGEIDPVFVHSWRNESDGTLDVSKQSKQVISQAELLPIALVKWSQAGKFLHRRVLFYIDNDGVRYSLIRGCSHSTANNRILDFINRIEIENQSWSWYTRVPSCSNPADAPSRGVLQPGPGNHFAQVVDMPKLDPKLILTPAISLMEMD
jgi:hypothetical protein